MDDLGVGKVGQITPAPQGIIEEPVHIGDLGVAIEGVLQSLEAAALDAHFLPVRQRGIDPRLAQRKHETLQQPVMELVAARVACQVPAADQLAFGDLYPVCARAGGKALQDGPGEGTGQRNDAGAHLAKGLFIHPAGIPREPA